MPTAYVLIQREELKSEELLLWTTKLSDHADFFIILQRMSVSMDHIFKMGRFLFEIQILEGKHGPGEPHPRGGLSQGAQFSRLFVTLGLGVFF